MPAGGIANPHSGGSGSPVDRQKDRSARSALNRRLGCKRAKHPRARDVGKPGSGAEPRLDAFGLASAAVRRRKAGAPPLWRAAALKASADGNVCRCCAANGWIAPFGASPPFCAGGESFLEWRRGGGHSSGAERVARTIFCVVIAGLDPAIHAGRWLAEIRRAVQFRRTSAWTTGSSPVVTTERTRHCERSEAIQGGLRESWIASSLRSSQ